MSFPLALTKLLAEWQKAPKDLHAITSYADKLQYPADFVNAVSRLTQALIETKPPQIFLFCDNAYAFAVGFFGILHAGKRLILPPNAQPGTLQSLVKGPAVLVSDRDLTPDGFEIIHPLSDLFLPCEITFSKLASHKEVIEIFTSGSMGQPKRVLKNLRQLEEEIFEFENLWGKQLSEAKIFSTVSHQHIYGLLFRLLWPLTSRRFFDSRLLLYPDQIKALLEESNACLISSPTYLKRLPQLLDFKKSRGHLRCIFSSGGILRTANALQILNESGIAPTEVFGSTETGGIAYRQRSLEKVEPLWKVFPRVSIRTNGARSALQVQSPFVSLEPGQEWLTTGDEVQRHGERHFTWLGRVDRIVKIEEKRLALEELENRLLDHPFIEEGAAVVCQRLQGREKIGFAAVLNAAGLTYLEETGHRELAKRLQEHLRHYLEALLIPKVWRFVENLPKTAEGKPAYEEIRALFAEVSAQSSAEKETPNLPFNPEVKEIYDA